MKNFKITSHFIKKVEKQCFKVLKSEYNNADGMYLAVDKVTISESDYHDYFVEVTLRFGRESADGKFNRTTTLCYSSGKGEYLAGQFLERLIGMGL